VLLWPSPRGCGEFAKGKLLAALSQSGEGKGREWGPWRVHVGEGEGGGSGQQRRECDGGRRRSGGALVREQGSGRLASGLAYGVGPS
jgi:hypothetical protein